MIDREWSLRWRPSIFSKLLAVMLGMVVILLLIVTAFFVYVVFPTTVSTSEQAAQQYANILAASSLSLESAKNIRKQVGLDIRYEGPDGSWTTSDSLPTIEQVRSGQARSFFGHEYHLEPAPKGGSYLLVWNVSAPIHGSHQKLLSMLLLLIMAVVLAAYWFQKRLLRPVKSLSNGVASMSAGQLDVVLPVYASDELGLLTGAFNEMVRRVNEMIQARDQLLLAVSHELRSPLTRLKVGLALLPEDENKAGLDSDVNEMETMISELLELERMRTPSGISRHKQDLVPILREVARTFENRPPGLQFAASPQSIFVSIDGNKIRTVIRNLLENAFKYSFSDSRPVDVCVIEEQQSVVIRVRDDGPGISAAHMTNIFEPFFRLDPSRSKKTGGYGLGLSICKRITEAHGGTIKVENNPGRGVLFSVTIPNMTQG